MCKTTCLKLKTCQQKIIKTLYIQNDRLLGSIKMFQRIPNGMEKHSGYNVSCKITCYVWIHICI